MHYYRAAKLGVWNGSRVRPGEVIAMAKELSEPSSWLVPADHDGPSPGSGGYPEELFASDVARELAEVNLAPIDKLESTREDGKFSKSDVQAYINKRSGPSVADGGGAGISEKADGSEPI